MKNIYVKDILRLTNSKLIKGTEDTILNSFSTDTRTIKENEIYLAIKGQNFDGNLFYEEALQKGCSGCILDKNAKIDMEALNKYPHAFIILVNDSLKCLQEIAKYKRSLYNIPVIGITGSVGKTSTKDIIANVLSQKYKVLKTEGNLNNHIGLPLTILKLQDHEALVVEMGMNNLGEISLLSKIAKPNVALITNIGTAHIGILGSRENILKAKLEILEGMEEGTLIINNDNDLLHEVKNKINPQIKVLTYSIKNESDYKATNISLNDKGSTFEILINKEVHSFQVNVPGEAFVLNSLAALIVGLHFNISLECIKEGILNFTLSSKRMEIEKIKNITLIKDFYNANLDSMKSAINYLGSLKETRKIAILGDMLELGSFSEELHREVGKCVYNNKIDLLITIGVEAKNIADECLKLGFNKNNILTYDSTRDAYPHIKNLFKEKDTILFKASNGMNFQEIYSLVKGDL